MPSLASVQANLPELSSWSALRDTLTKFKPDELAGKGRETVPHVTICYGLIPGAVSLDDVRSALHNLPPFRITFGKMNCFEGVEGGTQDVVYVEVEAGTPAFADSGLYQARARLESLQRDPKTYRDYVPHLTLAYVKRGLGPKWKGNVSDLTGEHIMVDVLNYSTPGYKLEGQHEITLSRSLDLAAYYSAQAQATRSPLLEPFLHAQDRA